MEAGVIEEIVGRLLNHTPLSITGHRYVRPSLDALRPAMETICTELSARVAIKCNPDRTVDASRSCVFPNPPERRKVARLKTFDRQRARPCWRRCRHGAKGGFRAA
jgi:hypothetical protein